MNILEAMWKGGFPVEKIEATFNYISVKMRGEMIAMIGEKKLDQWVEQQKVILDDIKNRI